MDLRTFVKRLQVGKGNKLLYTKNEINGVISVWKYKEKYILTWEEWAIGDQWNENAYTIDERYMFTNIEDIVSYCKNNLLDINLFIAN